MDSNKDNIKRINSVILHIEKNLSTQLTIDDLAEIAYFSKYHFNRVFKSVTGESVYHYIKRVRLEKAAAYLWSTEDSVKDIALKCGFNTTSNFSYNYKKRFGISAKEQRVINSGFKDDSIIPDITVSIKEFPNMQIAYIKSIGNNYFSDFNEYRDKLYKWAKARDLWSDGTQFFGLSYDSYYVTKKEHMRFDICVEVLPGTEANGEIGIKEFTKKKYATAVFNLSDSFERKEELFDELNTWVLNSGYQFIVGEQVLFLHEPGTGTGIAEVCYPIEAK